MKAAGPSYTLYSCNHYGHKDVRVGEAFTPDGALLKLKDAAADAGRMHLAERDGKEWATAYPGGRVEFASPDAPPAKRRRR